MDNEIYQCRVLMTWMRFFLRSIDSQLLCKRIRDTRQNIGNDLISVLRYCKNLCLLKPFKSIHNRNGNVCTCIKCIGSIVFNLGDPVIV